MSNQADFVDEENGDSFAQDEGKWSKHLELQQAITWESVAEGEVVYRSIVGNAVWEIRLNDFPDEPLYSVLIDHQEIFSFNNWPERWRRE